MKHRHRFLLGWMLLASVSIHLHGQAPPDPEINLFGDDFPQQPRHIRAARPPSATAVPLPDYPQALLFQDGRQVKGELVEVTETEIVWRRKDASVPLRFPRSEVRRITLVPADRLNEITNEAPSATPLATVKLPGGDWLRGALASPDGEAFTLTLGEGAPVQIARAQIEWLAFGPRAAPAYGLGVGAMALEGWLAGGTPNVEAKDGTVIVKDAAWIGRTLATPSRFEIAFEIPEEAEENLRLWLQPFDPRPNSYSTGTIQLKFGREKMQWLVFFDNIQPNDLALPAEAQKEKGPVRFRVFYDSPGQRVILFRNGRQLSEWSLKPKVEQPGMPRQDRLPRGLCFDYENRGQNSTLRFRRLNVLPWDGVVPGNGDPGSQEDRLSTPSTAPQIGRLQKVDATELIFAGQPVTISADTLVKFPRVSAPMDAAEATVSFGAQGEVSLGDLRMHDGKIRGRTVFAPSLEVATDGLRFIGFAPRPGAAPAAGDLLVFKNGDELPGALVTAGTSAPLRWRLGSGQEIDFQTDRVAGVRLTSSANRQPSGTIELRNGERIPGEMTSFGKEQMQWQHGILGNLAVDRSQLWRLYPNARQSLKDGGQAPESWLADAPKSRRVFYYNQVRNRKEAWLALDGRFVLRTRDGSASEQALGPNCDLGEGLDRFELRVDFNSTGDNPGTLNINFDSADQGRLAMSLSSYQMSVYVQSPKARNGGMNREFPFRDKLGSDLRQLQLRAFVNRPAGTVDFFLNGYYLGRTGQSVAERLPGLGKSIGIDTYTYGRTQVILSQITIVPWSGELPRPGESSAVTVLANGDLAPGIPASWSVGRWHVESEIGPLDLSPEKVQAIEFGGNMQPVASAARVRLVDGTALLVDRFEWSGRDLTAHHPVFGDLKIPSASVSELIYNPPPVRAPLVVDPKSVAKKEDENPIR